MGHSSGESGVSYRSRREAEGRGAGSARGNVRAGGGEGGLWQEGSRSVKREWKVEARKWLEEGVERKNSLMEKVLSPSRLKQ